LSGAGGLDPFFQVVWVPEDKAPPPISHIPPPAPHHSICAGRSPRVPASFPLPVRPSVPVPSPTCWPPSARAVRCSCRGTMRLIVPPRSQASKPSSAIKRHIDSRGERGPHSPGCCPAPAPHRSPLPLPAAPAATGPGAWPRRAAGGWRRGRGVPRGRGASLGSAWWLHTGEMLAGPAPVRGPGLDPRQPGAHPAPHGDPGLACDLAL